VQVGGDDEATAVVAQSFFPSPRVIHAGDTVDFKFASLHTVTFNAGQPDLPAIVPGPNPGELMFGPGLFPAGPAGPNVTFDGKTQISSGAPLQGPEQAAFRVTFTAPGVYGYVCVLHPGMRGEVSVREANAPLPETPAQSKARGQADLAALHQRMKAGKEMVAPAHAGSVHGVTAGLGDAFGVSALQFINGNVAVQRGDTVVWSNADPFEIHTVTFTSGAMPPEFGELRPQPSGPPMIVLPANVTGPVGGESYNGQGYVSSGILGPGSGYALRFDAPAGSYEYLCLVHPFMKGTITVGG
jgi:plastocyanin